MGKLRTLSKRITLLSTAMVLAGTSLAFFVPSRRASADPACQNGGLYLFFARGTTAPINSNEASYFFSSVRSAVQGVSIADVELGDLDDNGQLDQGGYPASTDYINSVTTGADQLIAHLNARSAACPNETIVLGGYSQGADVIGTALARQGYGDINSFTRSRIAHVALYGDPRFNGMTNIYAGCTYGPWFRGNLTCGVTSSNGVFTARSPYLPNDFVNKTSSWCDKDDGICNGNLTQVNYWPTVGIGSHNYAYMNTWIAQSRWEISVAAVRKIRELDTNSPVQTPTPPAGQSELPPNTLTLTQSISRSPAGSVKAYQPFTLSFQVQNTSGGGASIQRLVVAVRGPSGTALDIPCEGGIGLTLAANQTFTCNASLPTGYGQAGTYTMWADWLGYDGSWHQGQLGANTTMVLDAPYQISAVQPVSVGPANNVTMYTPLQWSYRMRNTSGSPISIQRAVVAVRGPSGNALDVACDGGANGFSLQPEEEWTCAATLPTGYGQAGNYTFWADWMDYSGVWHQGQLGGNKPLTLTQAPTLTIVQPISVGPSNYRPMLTSLWWSYRVKNTSGAWASIQRFSVPVRGPGGVPLDVQCENGTGVTLAPGEEWTCAAYLPTGYGSTGTFTFWADWLGYDGSWHAGQLGGTSPLTLY